MHYATTFTALPMACPQCETELDQSSGICPACRWDSSQRTMAPSPEAVDVSSFSDRYRGTEYEGEALPTEDVGTDTTRTRLLLLVSLAGVLGLFYIVAQAMYLI